MKQKKSFQKLLDSVPLRILTFLPSGQIHKRYPKEKRRILKTGSKKKDNFFYQKLSKIFFCLFQKQIFPVEKFEKKQKLMNHSFYIQKNPKESSKFLFSFLDFVGERNMRNELKTEEEKEEKRMEEEKSLTKNHWRKKIGPETEHIQFYNKVCSAQLAFKTFLSLSLSLSLI